MPRVSKPHDDTTVHSVKENRMVPLVALFPHPENFRSHPPEQINNLVASLERYGQVRSIVVQSNADSSYTIVAGHGVYLAAQKLSYQELRADILPSDWSPEQVKGYLVSDNLLSNGASDDTELLARLLQEQSDAGFDLASMGSDEETLRQMLESLGDAYFEPVGEDEQGKLDEKAKVTCPECGCNFEPK